MALEHEFYKLEFINGQQYTIEYQGERLSKLLDGSIIRLQHKDNNPIDVQINKLFLTQKIDKVTIGTQTKLWRVL